MFIYIPCTSNIVDVIENALIAGYTKTMIAKEFGISVQTLNRWINGNEISVRNRAKIGGTELFKHYQGSKIQV